MLFQLQPRARCCCRLWIMYSRLILLFSESESAALSPAFGFASWSMLWNWRFLKLLYNLTASLLLSLLLFPGQNAESFVGCSSKSFFFVTFMRRCNLLYTVLLHSFAIDSVHTCTPYNRSGRIAPLYTVYRVSWLIPQLCFADFDKSIF